MPHIYAVGDCAGYWQLAHTAFREGEVAAENACGHDAVVDNRGVPRPIYTDPEIAAVGLTEAQAREQYGDDVAVGRFPWAANARAVMQDQTVGWVKSIHETRYGELLGLVMVGPHVTDLIEVGVVAIDAESTVETVADGMAPHPTLAEAIKEAGLAALGRAIHIQNRKPRAAAKPDATSAAAWHALAAPVRPCARSVGVGSLVRSRHEYHEPPQRHPRLGHLDRLQAAPEAERQGRSRPRPTRSRKRSRRFRPQEQADEVEAEPKRRSAEAAARSRCSSRPRSASAPGCARVAGRRRAR